MHDGIAAHGIVALDQRRAKTFLELVRVALRHERRLGEDALRALAVRLQLGDRLGLGPMITPLIDEDRRLRENADLMAGRELDGPTAELMRKRRGIVLERMWARGTLLDSHMRAAGEIREACEAGVRTPNIPSMHPVQERVDSSLNPARLNPSLLQDARIERAFKRWLDVGLPRREAILEVVVHDKPLRETERKHDMANGTLAALVRAALDAYCRFASWTAGTRAID